MSGIKNIFKKIEKINVGLFKFVGIFYLLIIIRVFLENISSPPVYGGFFNFIDFFIHYPLFYFSIVAGILLILRLAAKQPLSRLMKFVFCGLPIIVFPPLIDLALTFGRGWQMAYLFQDLQEFVFSFFTFFGRLYSQGVTLGIRIEIALILIGLFLLVKYLTGSTGRSLIAAVGTYALIFLHNLPSVFVIIKQILIRGRLDYDHLFIFSNLDGVRPLGANLFGRSYFGEMAGAFDKYKVFSAQMSGLLFGLLLTWLILIFIIYNKKKFFAYLKNLRLTRIIYYQAWLWLGFFIAWKMLGLDFQINFFNIYYLILLGVLAVLNWALAVGINDIEDQEIDQVSNPGRPLASKKILSAEMKKINFIVGCQAVALALILGYHAFVLSIIFFILSYFYSTKPFYLRRWPIVSSFLLALAALVTALIGFTSANQAAAMAAFPADIALVIIAAMVLGVHVKDIKDCRGDKAAGVKTLVTIYGPDKGKRIIAGLVFIAYVLAPFFIDFRLILLSLIFGLASSLLIMRKKFAEWPLFVLLALYLLIAGFWY